ncbi:MAG: cation:proton antiporter [Patescibacteria group bacterium]
MHDNIFNELSYIIAVGAIIALIMRLIKQPLIIGHIITGIIVGPSLLGLTKSEDILETFSSIGVTLLLFIIGLGLSLRVIREVGKIAAIVGATTIALTTLLGYTVGLLINLNKTEALSIGIAISFSSTIIVLKLLSDKREQSRLHGKIITGILIVEDLVAAIALMALAARGNGASFDPETLGSLAIKGILLSVPLLLFGSYVLPKFHKLFAGSQEFLFLFAISWGLGVATLFGEAGFSLEIGALIAGISLASLPYTQEISSRLLPLRDFFIVVFFIALGSHLSFQNIADYMPIILIIFCCVVFVKPLIILITMGLLGYTKQVSFKVANALSQISEFSLIFLALGYKEGIISNNIITIITITTLMTIAFSTYTITYSDQLYKFLEKHFELFERKHPVKEHEQRTSYELVLFGYQKGGREFINVFKSMGKKFIVIDYDPEVIEVLDRRGIDYLYGDATDLELLKEAGIEKSKLIVSTITDHQANIFLIKHLEKINPGAVVLCHAGSVAEAGELYEIGASYVMMPHYIGSEKIGGFIRRSGLKKSEFRKYRDKHLNYLQTHFTSPIE